ncbi:AraC family transcriptional regulator [Paenibacillus sp. FSL H7-0326]|uniref:AraC family transcriptional regulator n=1 Tax=Paenibacillus sp. FSL H7-0326 TaxID=1921144 RepID=UPI0009F8F99F|nr:helix-turn-helix domain-containing protein [Paenibacillus sp. FSL H7-0326]
MKKRNSVFANLAISHVSIVLVIVLLLCSAFYVFFTNNYKEELHSKNRIMMQNTAQTIESNVLKRVEQIYLDISLDKSADLRLFADSSYTSHLSKVIDLQELIKSKVTNNSDLVHAVHLYYPEEQIMLSSNHGLNYNADQGSGSVYFADWINGMRASKDSSLWTATRLVPQDIYSSQPDSNASALFTYVHSYPVQSSGQNSDLLIAIDVKESAVSSIIQRMMPSQYKDTYTLDSSGMTISDVSKGSIGVYRDYDSGVRRALMSETPSGSFKETIHHTDYVVSYQTLETTGWKIYSAVPASTFYAPSEFIQKLIVGICLFAILLGTILSGILALASYNPIKRIVNKIKESTDHAPDQIQNEYSLIDTAFSKLSNKVSSLEETLNANSSVIKHNVVLNILRNAYTPEELTEELPFLGIPQPYTHYCCLLLNLGEAGYNPDHAKETFAYPIVNELNAASLHERYVIAEELPDNKVVVIVCTNSAGDSLLEQISDLLLSSGRSQFYRDIHVSWGCWVQKMKDIHRSYSEAVTLMKYGYFLPEQTILKDRLILARENSVEEIPQSLLGRFRDKLQNRQSEDMIGAVDALIRTLQEGTYPAHYCHFILANIVFMYSDHLKSIRYKPPGDEHADLYQQYLQLNHIHEFRAWITESIVTFTAQMDKRSSERAVSSIELARQYIDLHLSEDLSLDAVASKVFISPKYLSRLFKEELGVTYTEYVTTQRLEKAKTLIESNHLTIEQVASTVGYGTSAYFIKKFKETYGCTPRNYMRSIAEHM